MSDEPCESIWKGRLKLNSSYLGASQGTELVLDSIWHSTGSQVTCNWHSRNMWLSAKFARPSPPTECCFATHPRDQPGREGLAARLLADTLWQDSICLTIYMRVGDKIAFHLSRLPVALVYWATPISLTYWTSLGSCSVVLPDTTPELHSFWFPKREFGKKVIVKWCFWPSVHGIDTVQQQPFCPCCFQMLAWYVTRHFPGVLYSTRP